MIYYIQNRTNRQFQYKHNTIIYSTVVWLYAIFLKFQAQASAFTKEISVCLNPFTIAFCSSCCCCTGFLVKFQTQLNTHFLKDFKHFERWKKRNIANFLNCGSRIVDLKNMCFNEECVS